MERTGVVIGKVGGDKVRVRLLTPEACESCGACHMAASNSDYAIDALDPLGAEEGRKVLLEIAPRSVLKASAAVYVLPLVLFLGFYGAVFELLRRTLEERQAEMWGVAAGGLAVGVALFLMRRGRIGGRVNAVLPTVTALLDDTTPENEGPGCRPGP